jgi:hypothetical protein
MGIVESTSFCFDMTTGIGKSRLMGACIYYLYKTKGYKHFFILAPGNTIYDKMRREAVPGHPKYMFKGLEAEMGRPKVYDGENYLSYPVRYIQEKMVVEKTSDIQIFIFNISKIFTRGDIEFKFHKFNENLGGSFADVLRSFDDLVICMDEAHRYYAPASKKAINYLNPVLGLEYTATPKSTNKNIIYHYGLEDGAGKFLKIPVVMGRTNTAGYSDDDIEEMKLKDGIKLHERRKSIVYKYCIDNQLEQVKPIVLIACKDTTHARKIKEKIDSDAFFGGRYVGKVIEIDSIVRQKILDAVRKDLIGPASDCEQLNEVPTSSYITGLLYPADTDVTEDENYNDVEFTEKNFDADGETLEAGIFEEEEPEDRVKGGFQKPSSIGVSFYVSDDVQKINAYINWGKYYTEQVQGEVIDETLEEDAENKKKKKHTIYIREQMNDVVEIDFNEMGRSKQIPLESNGNIYIYVMKMQLDNGYKMVSVYLHNNDKSDGDEKEYEKVMFQVEMLIADDLMSPIFVPEYLCRKVELEDEYYYKGRPVYARGRGCAATWEKKAEEVNASAIKSSFIPDYEIPSVSAQIDDMPKYAFSMLQMGSPKKKSEVVRNLRILTEMYGSWITDVLTKDEAMQDDKFRATGQSIIDKCNDASRRMNVGIDLIENNDKVYQAFVFMNQAMYLQRSITAFSKDYGNGIPCSLIQTLNNEIIKYIQFTLPDSVHT